MRLRTLVTCLCPVLVKLCLTPPTSCFLLTAALRVSTRLDHLQKESFDNVAAYLQKKQQRLQEQQRKRAGPRHANATKKTKMVEEPSS